MGNGVHPAVVRRVESRCAEPCGFGKRLVQLRFEILFQPRVAAGQFDPVAQIVEYVRRHSLVALQLLGIRFFRRGVDAPHDLLHALHFRHHGQRNAAR